MAEYEVLTNRRRVEMLVNDALDGWDYDGSLPLERLERGLNAFRSTFPIFHFTYNDATKRIDVEVNR